MGSKLQANFIQSTEMGQLIFLKFLGTPIPLYGDILGNSLSKYLSPMDIRILGFVYRKNFIDI